MLLKLLIAAAVCLSAVLPSAQVRRVVDGDTVDLYHLGVPPVERIRVLGVDAWDSYRQPKRSEFASGATGDSLYVAAYTRWIEHEAKVEAATKFTTAWLAAGQFTLTTCRRDSFGRPLAWVTRGSDSLHVALVIAGHGVRATER